MPFEKLNKLLVAFVCAFALAACQTTPEEEVVVETDPVPTETVETNTVTEPVISAEERMRMESEEKRKERTIYFEFDDTTGKADYLEVLELHAKFLME